MSATGPRRRWIRDLLGWKTIPGPFPLLRAESDVARDVTLTSPGLTTPWTVRHRRSILNPATGNVGPSNYQTRVPVDSVNGCSI